MVFLPENRSRIAACCWSVLVLKGASALSSFSVSSILATEYGTDCKSVADGVGIGLGLGFELGSVVLGQARLELVGGGGRAGRAHGRGDLPVFLGDEGPDVALAVGDQPHGDRLNAAGAQVARTHLLPQERAELIADKAIEEPSGLLGVDHVHVDRPGPR